MTTEIESSTFTRLVGFSDLDERIASTMSWERAHRWRAYRADWKRGAVERPFPLQIDFALNDSCNLRCPMCTWSEEGKVGTRTKFDLSTYRRIVTDGVARGLCAVGLNGVNEPLMRRDLPEFVRVANEVGVLDIMLHTNAMLLTSEMARGLIDAGLTRLFVSLDAVTQKTYDTIRVGGDLALVRRNVDTFLALRGAEVLPVLGVCFVRMALNDHEYERFIEEWRGRADFYSVQSYMNPFGPRTDKVSLAAVGTSAPTHHAPCAQPFQRLRVNVGGEVHPCCSFYGDHMVVGLVEEGIDALWRGVDMTHLRRLHATGELWTGRARHGRPAPGEVCRQCLRHSYTA